MSGEVMDIGHDDGFGALPSRAADTFTIRNARTRNRTLERSQDEFADSCTTYLLNSFSPYSVESRPPEAESLVQGSCHVRHVGYRV